VLAGAAAGILIKPTAKTPASPEPEAVVASVKADERL